MIIEVDLLNAGAVALIAQVVGASIENVEIEKDHSKVNKRVRIWLSGMYTANQVLVMMCESQGLLCKVEE